MTPGEALNPANAELEAVAGPLGVAHDVLVSILTSNEKLYHQCARVLAAEGFRIERLREVTELFQTGEDAEGNVLLVEESAWTKEIQTRWAARREQGGAFHQRVILFHRSDTSATDLHVDEILAYPVDRHQLVARVRGMAIQALQEREIMRGLHRRSELARMWSVLHGFMRIAPQAADLDELLDSVVRTAAEMTCCRQVSIVLPDAKNSFLRIARSIGMDQAVAESVRIPVSETVGGKAYREGQPMVAFSCEESPLHRHGDREAEWASLPLVYTVFNMGQIPVGMLTLTDRIDDRPFDHLELEFIDLLGGLVGSTIDEMISRCISEDARDSIVVALATLAEYRDNETGLHVERVTQFAVMLAESLREEGPYANRIDDAFIRNLRRAAPLHDIGKVAIPDAILLKPGRLTEAETLIMRTHAMIGRDTIRSVIARSAPIDFLTTAEQITGGHHEWFDGSGRGYPLNLAGQDIPLAARIVALADVYDAVTTRRVYKDAQSHEEARAIVVESSGSQFDPVIVEAFLRRELEFARFASDMAGVDGEAPNSGQDSHRSKAA